MKRHKLRLLSFNIAFGIMMGISVVNANTQNTVKQISQQKDQLGMARHLNTQTLQRCIPYLSNPDVKIYDLAHERSNEMLTSPFAEKEQYHFDSSHGIPNTQHGYNTESIIGNMGGQGTQFDALGHFAYLSKPWDGTGNFPAEDLQYFGGWTQKEVKPTPNSPLLALGMEQVPPIISSAVLLDAAEYLNKGKPLDNNQVISKADIEGMLNVQGLAERGLLSGDVLLIHTGWGQHWDDPITKNEYYKRGPGLGLDAAYYLQDKKVVLLSLDNAFTDPAPNGMLEGTAQPTNTPKHLPFAIHHQNLTQAGIYQIENSKLDQLAKDKVWTSCIIAVPLNIKGIAQSPIRPIVLGIPSIK
ncbi:cyclase family protein [Acinetobacter guillouiae]|uniref:cyclase family protein n=2 Tax=Acinetobacter guillouiae TaxID=106649 RepID=UPI00333F5F7D